MLVIKAHKILLRLAPESETTLLSWCGAARWAYNYGLERKKVEYEADKKSPRSYTLAKEIVILKKTREYVWLCGVPKSIPRTALAQLDAAYAGFFRRVKNGAGRLGFPKFKSKKRSRLSFHLEPDAMAVDGNRVRIPKIGWLRMHQAIRFAGRLVGTVCISSTAGKWYISFSVETKVPDPIEKQEKVAVGLDVGVRTLATLSDGKKFDNPKAFYRREKLLAGAQRQITRKQKGSKRWQKAKIRVQRIHKRIADLRADATHRVSAHIVAHYDGVAIEDLNIRGMVRNRHLAKSILDANMAELHRQLMYKMAWACGEVQQVGRFFPSSKLCHVCGLVNTRLTLADREWDCECGTHHDRDVNAAINLAIKCFGRGLTATARGGPGATRPFCETRTTCVGRVLGCTPLDLAV